MIVAAVVVIAIVVVIILNLGPKIISDDQMESIVDKFNEGDLEAAYGSTIFSLGENQLEEKVMAFGDYPPEITMAEMSVTGSRDMTDAQKEDAGETAEYIETEYDVKVREYCLMEYDMTADYGGYQDHISGEVLCVYIDGDWYLTEMFDVYPSVLGTWEVKSLVTYDDSGGTAVVENAAIIMEFQEGGNGMMSYSGESISFEWVRTSHDQVLISLDMEINFTYVIDGNNLMLTGEIDGEKLVMTLERRVV